MFAYPHNKRVRADAAKLVPLMRGVGEQKIDIVPV